MKQSKKWSEQVLVEESFGHKDENGNEVINKLNVLNVCLSGKELYRKEFIDGKYKDKKKFQIPFDFIVENGDMSPKGKFYELEYFIGERGMVYRALIQAVDPVTDIPLIIGTLKQKNLLPADFNAQRAWLRSDIDAVCIGNCSKDEDGEAAFYSGHNEARDGIMDDGIRMSILDYAVKYGNLGCNFDYYRGDCREVWIPQECDCSKEKVFICGVNGNDPEFADKREEDMERLHDLLGEIAEIIDDYQLPHFITIFDDPKKDPYVACKITNVALEMVLKGVLANVEQANGNA